MPPETEVDSVRLPLVALRVTCAVFEVTDRKLSATDRPVTGSVPACLTARAVEGAVIVGAPTTVSDTLCEEDWGVLLALFPRSLAVMVRVVPPVKPVAGV